MEGFYSAKELAEFGFAQIGNNILISKKASIYQPDKISLGSNIRIDDFCFIVGCVALGNYIHLAPFSSIHGTGGGTVELKDFAGLSSYSTIYSCSDDYSGEALTNPMIDEEFRKYKCTDIVLEKHTVVGLHSVLLPGAYLAEGSALGAMSMLTTRTDSWGIYAGIPAERIKERKTELLQLEKQFLAQKMQSSFTFEAGGII